MVLRGKVVFWEYVGSGRSVGIGECVYLGVGVFLGFLNYMI